MKNELELAIEAIKNREIKFRAWHIPTKTMCYVENMGLGIGCINACPYGKGVENCILDSWSNFVLMQYTGIKDKHGKEIYVGDIITAQWKTTSMIHTLIVETNRTLYNLTNIEIIGNVFETPQLFTDKL
jgi:uncharacterized phage protein (TIGR01671 family)